MRQLLLLRHAQADAKRAGQTDRDRQLGTQGLKEAVWAGQTLRQLGLRPDLVLVSPARRTMETCKALAPWHRPAEAVGAPDIRIVETLYLADMMEIARVLRADATDAKLVLMIGHNPGLQIFASHLAGLAGSLFATHFPTASLACFDVAQEWPSHISVSGVRLSDFLIPPP